MDTFHTSLAYFQAATLLLSDRPKKPVDALFFHSRAKGDHDGLFELAQEFWQKNLVEWVVIQGSDGEREGGNIPGEANPGKTFYQSRLGEAGIDSEKVVVSKPSYNTRTEGDTFLTVAKELGWGSAVVLCQPHQVVRCFLGYVQGMKELAHEMKLFIASPNPASWWNVTCGSQGKEELERFHHIEKEFSRIPLYQQEGQIVSFDELFDYLRRRDIE